MCGKCEPLMAKGAIGVGLVSILLALASRLTGLAPMGLGPRSFEGMATCMLLLAIALNTLRTHEHT